MLPSTHIYYKVRNYNSLSPSTFLSAFRIYCIFISISWGFGVLAILQNWGCGGQECYFEPNPKVKSQMSIANEHTNTFDLANFEFKDTVNATYIMAFWDRTPCKSGWFPSKYLDILEILFFNLQGIFSFILLIPEMITFTNQIRYERSCHINCLKMKIGQSIYYMRFFELVNSKYAPPIKWGCWQNLHFWSTGGPLGNTYLMFFFSSLISFPSGWTVIVSQPVHLYKWPSLLVDSLHFFWKKRIRPC